MATKVSNPRDLLVLLLGELLHVERRLAGEVLQALAQAVRDDDLTAALEHHLAETRTHVERVEVAFRRLEVSPSANLSRPFESAVAQHDELAPSVGDPRLADVFHAQAALHTEHWEIAAYRSVLELGEQSGRQDDLRELRDSLHDEERAADILCAAIGRLASTVAAPP